MNKCKNCGVLTKNKKFCSRQCQREFKFKRFKKKQSKLEKFISERLKIDYPQLIVEECNRTILGCLELDIFLPQLGIGIEVNGKMHYKFIEYFHHNYKNFQKQLYRDQLKKVKCSNLGIFLIVIPNLKQFTLEYGMQIYNHLKAIIYMNLNPRTCLSSRML